MKIDFGNKEDKLNGTDAETCYTKKTTFKVKLTDYNGTALADKSVEFTINNKLLAEMTDSSGIATLKINLKPGTYYIVTEYGDIMTKNKIVVKKSIITKDVTKKYKKSGKFKVKILNKNGKVYAKQTVKIKFKGKTYSIKTNKKGIATFKLSKKLKKDKYTIKTTYAGMTVKNKIAVKK